MQQVNNDLSLAQFLAKPATGLRASLIKMADRLLGINKLNQLYQQHGFAHLDGQNFLDAFVRLFKLNISSNFHNLAKDKPLIIVANHPLGGVDGVVLLRELLKQRNDVKVLANLGLSLFKPLQKYFIFTNPLQTGATGNVTSLRLCEQHLQQKGVLVIFPAGRVSYYQKAFNTVSDHTWNRSFIKLAERYNADILPVHIQASNRKRFYFFGRIYFRFRLLMLVREMLASTNKNIQLTMTTTIDNTAIPNLSTQQQSDLVRLATYLQQPSLQGDWPAVESVKMQALAPAESGDLMAAEVNQIAEAQTLVSYKTWLVLHADGEQIPHCLAQIRRLREQTFRDWQEGSGAAQDGDDFDYSYQHLFIFDQQQQQIIGAYRMGQTDQISPTYLEQMFNFSAKFVGKQTACLEMGRSFIVSEYQRSYQALLMLFKGIGHFVVKYPKYRTLYGTVSLSRCYSPLSVYLIEQFLIKKPDSSALAKQSFAHAKIAEVQRFLDSAQQHNKICSASKIEILDWLVKQIEPDNKGLPVLVKQYHQLGAEFIALAIDGQFAQTPGLLLKVHLPDTADKWLKLYLGKNWQNYRRISLSGC
ncbi:lysophospholipid acyltransferase family protein [Catenovulum sp. SX2]|uniref:lysophospholipid acyltransferase family protein n=1 Tax=Catenovulum sp. SX2 TaxID=3398614 RepID=UPI003F830BF9